MSVNKVILVGRLGRDPETRYTGGGQAVGNFSVATDETYKDRNGERQKRTEWHRITVWGKQAEIAQQYLKKGSLVFIEGRIQSREWQDKEGQKRTSYDIIASNFRMLGGRADSAAAGGSAASLPRRRPGACPREISLHRSHHARLDGYRQLSARRGYRRSDARLRLCRSGGIAPQGIQEGRQSCWAHRSAGLLHHRGGR